MELIKLESFKEPIIKAAAQDIIQAVLDGDTNPIHVKIQANALSKLAKEVSDGVNDLAIEEAAKYSKSDSVFNGSSFSLSQSGNTLNYEDDYEYLDLKNRLDARKKLLKSSYDLFVRSGQTVFDTITGEIVPIVSIKKESESIIKISFK